MKAEVFLADGFEECEALMVVDILRRAGIETLMASIMDDIHVDSSRHIIIRADALAKEVDDKDVDLLILPGGRLGTKNLMQSEHVLTKCKEYVNRKTIAAICAAPSILAEQGLLEGKKATCHPDYEKKMCGAILTHGKVAVDGNIITGQGLGTVFEFAFTIVKKFAGEEAVRQIKASICYE